MVFMHFSVCLFFFPGDAFYEYAVGSLVEMHRAKPRESFSPS